jgi:hypothetical protein
MRQSCICLIGLQYQMIGVPRIEWKSREGKRLDHRKEESPEGLVVDDESKCPVSGKRKYASEAEALATASHQLATSNAPKELRAYLCSWCDAWHLTKKGGRAGKDRR